MTRTLKPSIATYLFFSGVPGVVTIGLVYPVLFVDSNGWPLLLVCLLLALAGAFGVSRFQIGIQDETLSYRSLFKNKRSLTLAEIAQARVDVGLLKGGQRSGQPPFALVVEPYPNIGKPPIIINMKVFKLDDLQILFKFFGDKLIDKHKRIVHGVPRMIKLGKGQ